MTVKEKLEEALAAKDNNIKSFVWKGEREEVNGERSLKVYRESTSSEYYIMKLHELREDREIVKHYG